MKKLILLISLFALLIPIPVQAQEQDPWSQVFDSNGELRPDVVDLGVTTGHPDWMSVDLPFGQSLNLEANYHRFQTSDGNIVLMPSASTLFFMAMNPQESGLTSSSGRVNNSQGDMINFLGHVAGDSLNWDQVTKNNPAITNTDQFWNAVLNGQQDAWTFFTGWGFITNLLALSKDDAALRTTYLLYLDGARKCASIPGGCAGITPVQSPTQAMQQPTQLPQTHPTCPQPTVTVQAITASIQKVSPANPLVVGQDTEARRGADIQAKVSVPPVIFTWFEPIYEEREICRGTRSGETSNCNTGSSNSILDGVTDTEQVLVACNQHIEHLSDAVTSLQATATLDAASQDWIIHQLGQTHYGAYVHQSNFTLIPGLGSWSGGCDGGGTCTAAGAALKVPFADPGTFSLTLKGTTAGTQFMGTRVTQPRNFEASGKFQVYVTLPALVP